MTSLGADNVGHCATTSAMKNTPNKIISTFLFCWRGTQTLLDDDVCASFPEYTCFPVLNQGSFSCLSSLSLFRLQRSDERARGQDLVRAQRHQSRCRGHVRFVVLLRIVCVCVRAWCVCRCVLTWSSSSSSARRSDVQLKELVQFTAPGGRLYESQEKALLSMRVWERLFDSGRGARGRGRPPKAPSAAET